MFITLSHGLIQSLGLLVNNSTASFMEVDGLCSVLRFLLTAVWPTMDYFPALEVLATSLSCRSAWSLCSLSATLLTSFLRACLSRWYALLLVSFVLAGSHPH